MRRETSEIELIRRGRDSQGGVRGETRERNYDAISAISR